MKPVILIPTYNESVAIVELLKSLAELHQIRDFDVLVIDDNSPDRTADIVDTMNFSWVEILRRPKKSGLGAAYRAGFAHVLPTGRYSKIVTMDADGSHRVEDLPAMLDATDAPVSITLGTRWMPGGSVVNWPKSRQLLSKSGTRYARLALGIPLNDLTGGFRVYSAELLNRLKLSEMTATGYCFQIEMAMAARLAGAQMVEVPITFVERINGVSKMSRAIIVEALWQTTLWGLARRLRPNADKLHYLTDINDQLRFVGAITPRVWVEIKKRRLINPFREVLKYGNEAVQEWLLMHGINYRIITEQDIRENRLVPNGINLPTVDLRHEKAPSVELSSLQAEIDNTLGRKSSFSI